MMAFRHKGKIREDTCELSVLAEPQRSRLNEWLADATAFFPSLFTPLSVGPSEVLSDYQNYPLSDKVIYRY